MERGQRLLASNARTTRNDHRLRRSRGTGLKGRDFKKVTQNELGKYEVEDQIAAARELGNRSYIDKDHIGIWGWSYGGFMSTNCL